MKRLSVIIVSILFVASIFTFTTSAAEAAKNGDIIKIAGEDVKILSNFEQFEDAHRPGSGEDKIFSSSLNTDAEKIKTEILAGKGIDDSKGLVFAVDDTYDNSSGTYFHLNYKIALDEKAVSKFDVVPKKIDGIVFWIDATSSPDEEAAFQFVISEFDYDANGNQVVEEDELTGGTKKVITNRMPADDVETFYYLQDADGNWVEENAGGKGTSGSYIRIPNTYKGYVKLPLDIFDVVWSSKDTNSTWDWRHISDIQIFTGLYPKHVDNPPLIFDNFAVAGDFEATPDTTKEPTKDTTKEPTKDTTKDNPTNEATTTPTGQTTSVDTSSPATGISGLSIMSFSTILLALVVLKLSNKNKQSVK